jgi:hypothetical protein
VKEGPTVYVVLNDGTSEANQSTNTDEPYGVRSDQSELVESLLEQLAYMREQLAEEREARRRADTIMAQLSQANAEQARTIRALEPPQDTQEAPVTSSEEDSDSDEIPPEQQEPVERRSWLYRFFFGP